MQNIPVLIALILTGSSAYAQDSQTFIGLGDWGWTSQDNQILVAQAMADWAVDNQPQFVVTVGDNIYPDGVNSTDDPQFETKWIDIYNVHEELEDLPWYVCLGNADYGTYENQEEWHMVAYSEVNSQWIAPNLWHSFYMEVGEVSVHFVVIDTEVFELKINDYPSHIEWLEEELSGSEADYIIVVGHRHMYSAGTQGPFTDILLEELLPLLEENQVDMYMYGHDHNLQHIHRSEGSERADIDFVLTGGGGGTLLPYRPVNEDAINEAGMDVRFFAMSHGFAAFTVTEESLSFDLINQAGDVLYSYSRPRMDKDL